MVTRIRTAVSLPQTRFVICRTSYLQQPDVLDQALHASSHVVMREEVQDSKGPRGHKAPSLRALEGLLCQQIDNICGSRIVLPSWWAPTSWVVERVTVR